MLFYASKEQPVMGVERYLSRLLNRGEVRTCLKAKRWANIDSTRGSGSTEINYVKFRSSKLALLLILAPDDHRPYVQ